MNADNTRNTYCRDVDLAARFKVSRTTIWRWAAAGDFPKPVRLSTGCTRWRLSDADAWERERAAKGRAA